MRCRQSQLSTDHHVQATSILGTLNAPLAGTDERQLPAGNLRRRPGDSLSHAAIGALLRTRRLVPVARISKAIGPATHNVAEYRALIEGLMLARSHGIEHIRVYTDSELVVDQVIAASAVKQAHLRELYENASGLRVGFKSFRISWVPREWNLEADQLVRDALGGPATS